MEHDPPDADPLEEDDEAAFAHPLEEDIRCLGCGYNLRALKPLGKCPECGFPILNSLHFSEEKVLCLGCMRPNHPLAAHCEFCGAPISGAAAASAYFQTSARGVRGKPKSEREADINPPSATLMVLSWFFGFPIALFLGLQAITAWEDDKFGTDALVPGIFAAAFLGFILLVTWSHYHCYHIYQSRIGDAQDDDDDDSTKIRADAAEEATDESEDQ